MLRPERMSKVSVTGSKAVMDDVVETVHDLHLVHLSDYDGRWDGFDNGDPMAGGDEASEKLVTVRSLKSILGVTEDDAGPSRIVSDDDLDAELEEVRQEANELDDRRDEIRGELRDVDEEIGAMAPFAELGIDLDLLWGYDTLAVAVGEGDDDSVEAALADLDAPSQVYSDDDVVAAFAYADEDALDDALVDAEFSAIEVPQEEGDPESYLDELEHRRSELEANLETVEQQIEDLRYDVAGFLLAAEETLAIEARKAEAPLSFATTENAFVAEGWIPTEQFGQFESAVHDAVGDSADVEELEVAAYDRHGHAATHEDAADHEHAATADISADTGAERDDAATAEVDDEDAEPAEATTDGGAEVRSDGGVVTMGDDDPPVIQDNPGFAQPFELLTKAVGRPNYTELDPTVILFVTFPLMFGFIIGDIGYGIIYTGIGYYIYSRFDSDTFRNLGVITMAAGVMTGVFGLLYGEMFGLHFVTDYVWSPLLGMDHPPIEKGLSPATSHWASAWFIVTVLFGLLHLNTAYVLSFVENTVLHGVKEAVIESGSWLLALNGLWLFVFSRLFDGSKPDLLYTTFGTGEEAPAAIELGFTGFPVIVGWIGLAMVGLGMLMLAIGPAHELIEIHVTLAHVLSYLRIAAVLLAKAGMAFAANLLFFGAYESHGEFHFMTAHGPEWVQAEYGADAIIFGGMFHGGPAMLAAGVVVLVLAHIVVLILGVTSAGIQSIRLEYFEFFEKFFDGNGETYRPFGTDRSYTRDE